jgi:Zn-dependent protease
MFNRKLKLFRLFGFEVGIDLTWIVLAVLVAWSLSTGYFPYEYQDLSTRQDWVMGVIGALGLFVSIVAHEFCHSLVARRSGMPMKGITLFIFGGVAEMTEEPQSARDEFLIAVVGPISSFAMAAIFHGLNRIGEAAGWPTTISGVMGYLGMINIILAVFNLVPPLIAKNLLDSYRRTAARRKKSRAAYARNFLFLRREKNNKPEIERARRIP